MVNRVEWGYRWVAEFGPFTTFIKAVQESNNSWNRMNSDGTDGQQFSKTLDLREPVVIGLLCV